MSTQESGGGLTKWQIAVLVGAPVAAACILGAFYYWKSSQTSKDQDAEKEKERDKSEVPGNEAPKGDDVSEENLVAWKNISST